MYEIMLNRAKFGKYFLLFTAIGLYTMFISLLTFHFYPENGQTASTAIELEELNPRRVFKQVSHPAAGISQGEDLREAANVSVAAVVHVRTVKIKNRYIGNPFMDYLYGTRPKKESVPVNTGIGSGVIVSDNGYIVTNNHVIAGNDEIYVTLNDKREFKAEIVGKDEATDIALLKIDAEDLPILNFGNSDDVALGEWVLAVGNPFNLTSTVTAGIISAKSRYLGINGDKMGIESFIQTDAAVNPGNSGGALVNAKGELIGINTAIESPTGVYSGYAFAVPINIVSKVITDLKEYGHVQRAGLGIQLVELNPSLAREFDLSSEIGLAVAGVYKGSSADNAGMEPGDIIRKINDVSVRTISELQAEMEKYRPGKKITIEVERKGNIKKLDVKLESR